MAAGFVRRTLNACRATARRMAFGTMQADLKNTANFRQKNRVDERLFEGNTSFHKSNQPQAMETMQNPALCLVA